MKIQRLIFISAVALAVIAIFSLNAANAQLTLASWSDTWHEVTFKGEGPCAFGGSSKLFNNAESFPGYIYLVTANNNAGPVSAVVAIELYKDEWKGGLATFELELGDAYDGVFKTSSAFPIELAGYSDTYTMFFYFRLSGKVKDNDLSTGKIASVAGYLTNNPTDGDGKCTWNLGFSGGMVDVSNVPDSAQEEVNYILGR